MGQGLLLPGPTEYGGQHSVAGAPHILIVEDHPNTAEMLTAYFTGQGYRVTAAGWGREGVKLAEEDRVRPDRAGHSAARH